MRAISLSFESSSEAVVTRLIDWPNIVFRYSKKPSQNTRLLCKHRAVSLLLRPAIKVCKQFGSDVPDHTKSYNLVRLCESDDHHTLKGTFQSNTFFQMHAKGETGGPDPPPPWKITKIYGFLAILIITKLPSQHSMVGHYRQWRFADGPMVVHF